MHLQSAFDFNRPKVAPILTWSVSFNDGPALTSLQLVPAAPWWINEVLRGRGLMAPPSSLAYTVWYSSARRLILGNVGGGMGSADGVPMPLGEWGVQFQGTHSIFLHFQGFGSESRSQFGNFSRTKFLARPDQRFGRGIIDLAEYKDFQSSENHACFFNFAVVDYDGCVFGKPVADVVKHIVCDCAGFTVIDQQPGVGRAGSGALGDERLRQGEVEVVDWYTWTEKYADF